jgi:hypothetical protein
MNYKNQDFPTDLSDTKFGGSQLSMNVVAVGLESGEIKLVDVINGKEIATLQGHRSRVNSVCFHPGRGEQDPSVKTVEPRAPSKEGTGEEEILLVLV